MLNQHYKCTAEGSTYQDCNEQCDAKVTSKPYSDSEPDVSYAKRTLNFIKKLLGAFFMFTSPYAILTQVAIPYFFIAVFLAGMNQLTDLEIDKINKPYLPLASGQISFTTGVIIAASSLALSLWLGWVMGSWPLIVGLLWCCGLSIAYSINTSLKVTMKLIDRLYWRP
ncbi:hypothetical protein Fmac_027492 [Flemingia macrophylla]|uniref:Homogentisate phytyltransferase n=1 Tax=Flemingia macrophylla TaxID=520843 RepID=A0ABD1LHV2_9FABA